MKGIQSLYFSQSENVLGELSSLGLLLNLRGLVLLLL